MSETTSLEVTDLVEEMGVDLLRVRRKGGRVEIVRVNHDLARALCCLVSGRARGPLLTDDAGVGISRFQAHRLVAALGRDAGIDHAVYPHLLRHSCSSLALRAGVTVPVVAHALAHRDVRTTLGYARRLAGESMVVQDVLLELIESDE